MPRTDKDRLFLSTLRETEDTGDETPDMQADEEEILSDEEIMPQRGDKVTVQQVVPEYNRGCYVSLPLGEVKIDDWDFMSNQVVIALTQYLQATVGLTEASVEIKSQKPEQKGDDSPTLHLTISWDALDQKFDESSVKTLVLDFLSGLHNHNTLSHLSEAIIEPAVHSREVRITLSFPEDIDEKAVAAYMERIAEALGKWDDKNGYEDDELAIRYDSHTSATLTLVVESPVALDEDILADIIPTDQKKDEVASEEEPEEEASEDEESEPEEDDETDDETAESRQRGSIHEVLGYTIKPGDKRVIDAFFAHQEAEGPSLFSDGEKITAQFHNYVPLAQWVGDQAIKISGPDGNISQTWVNAIRKVAKAQRPIVTVESKQRVREDVGSHGLDEDAVRELQLFIENDGDLYRGQYTSILKNLALKVAQGVYEHELAKKMFMYVVDSGAKKYVQEFGDGRSWHKMFSMDVRQAIAANLADAFRTEWNLGNYAHLMPLKYRDTDEFPKIAESKKPVSYVGQSKTSSKVHKESVGDDQPEFILKGLAGPKDDVYIDRATDLAGEVLKSKGLNPEEYAISFGTSEGMDDIEVYLYGWPQEAIDKYTWEMRHTFMKEFMKPITPRKHAVVREEGQKHSLVETGEMSQADIEEARKVPRRSKKTEAQYVGAKAVEWVVTLQADDDQEAEDLVRWFNTRTDMNAELNLDTHTVVVHVSDNDMTNIRVHRLIMGELDDFNFKGAKTTQEGTHRSLRKVVLEASTRKEYRSAFQKLEAKFGHSTDPKNGGRGVAEGSKVGELVVYVPAKSQGLAEKKVAEAVGATKPAWEYQDARGVTHTGYVDSTKEYGGSDVEYFMRDEVTGELSVVSGRRLKDMRRLDSVVHLTSSNCPAIRTKESVGVYPTMKESENEWVRIVRPDDELEMYVQVMDPSHVKVGFTPEDKNPSVYNVGQLGQVFGNTMAQKIAQWASGQLPSSAVVAESKRKETLKFRDLSVGEVFVFASEEDLHMQVSGIERGPWVKTGSRTYQGVDTHPRYAGTTIRVGSINVEVIPKQSSDSKGDMVKEGKYLFVYDEMDGPVTKEFDAGSMQDAVRVAEEMNQDWFDDAEDAFGLEPGDKVSDDLVSRAGYDPKQKVFLKRRERGRVYPLLGESRKGTKKESRTASKPTRKLSEGYRDVVEQIVKRVAHDVVIDAQASYRERGGGIAAGGVRAVYYLYMKPATATEYGDLMFVRGWDDSKAPDGWELVTGEGLVVTYYDKMGEDVVYHWLMNKAQVNRLPLIAQNATESRALVKGLKTSLREAAEGEWFGVDGDLETSLLEYGFVLREDPVGSGQYRSVYGYNDTDDAGHYDVSGVGEHDLDDYAEIDEFLSLVEMTKEDWLSLPIQQKVYDVRLYKGDLDAVFGDNTSTMTTEEALMEIGLSPNEIDATESRKPRKSSTLKVDTLAEVKQVSAALKKAGLVYKEHRKTFTVEAKHKAIEQALKTAEIGVVAERVSVTPFRGHYTLDIGCETYDELQDAQKVLRKRGFIVNWSRRNAQSAAARGENLSFEVKDVAGVNEEDAKAQIVSVLRQARIEIAEMRVRAQGSIRLIEAYKKELGRVRLLKDIPSVSTARLVKGRVMSADLMRMDDGSVAYARVIGNDRFSHLVLTSEFEVVDDTVEFTEPDGRGLTQPSPWSGKGKEEVDGSDNDRDNDRDNENEDDSDMEKEKSVEDHEDDADEITWNEGAKLQIKAYQSAKGEGLSYPDMRVMALDDGFAGGWDVYDGVDDESGEDVSFYGFSVEGFVTEQKNRRVSKSGLTEGYTTGPDGQPFFPKGSIWQTVLGKARVVVGSTDNGFGAARFRLLEPTAEAEKDGWEEGDTFLAHPDDQTVPSPKTWVRMDQPGQFTTEQKKRVSLQKGSARRKVRLEGTEFHVKDKDALNRVEGVNDFVRGYLEAAFFTSSGDVEDEVPEDKGIADLAPASLQQAISDCHKFQQDNAELLQQAYDSNVPYDEERAGNDFWYTRNQHGVGFWDRDLGEIGEALTKAADAYREVYLMMDGDEVVLESQRNKKRPYVESEKEQPLRFDSDTNRYNGGVKLVRGDLLRIDDDYYILDRERGFFLNLDVAVQNPEGFWRPTSKSVTVSVDPYNTDEYRDVYLTGTNVYGKQEKKGSVRHKKIIREKVGPTFTVEMPTEKAVAKLFQAPKNFWLQGVDFEHDDGEGSINGVDALERLLDNIPAGYIRDYDLTDTVLKITMNGDSLVGFQQDTGYAAMDYETADAIEEFSDADHLLGVLKSIVREYGVGVDLFDFYHPSPSENEETGEEEADMMERIHSPRKHLQCERQRWSNDVRLYCTSMGKIHTVSHMAWSGSEAVSYAKKHPTEVEVSEEFGKTFFAEQYGLTTPSRGLRDAGEDLKLMCVSQGKVFKVRLITDNMDEVNTFLQDHEECGVIAEDKDQWWIMVADNTPLRVSVLVLPGMSTESIDESVVPLQNPPKGFLSIRTGKEEPVNRLVWAQIWKEANNKKQWAVQHPYANNPEMWPASLVSKDMLRRYLKLSVYDLALEDYKYMEMRALTKTSRGWLDPEVHRVWEAWVNEKPIDSYWQTVPTFDKD